MKAGFKSRYCCGLLVATILLLAGRICGAELTVFAAASLSEALREIVSHYENVSRDKVALNLGASSMLARQIEEGAPVDIFFSADEAKMDALDAQGLILKQTRRTRLSNTLVIVVAREQGAAIASPKDLADPRVKRIALGDPRAVPIGVYAKGYLEGLNLWKAVGPKVVPTENVRAALAAVEAGNADASIVYRTDAAISKKLRVAFEVPSREGPKISYPMAMVKGARELRAAEKFLAHLNSEDAAKVFRKFGFIVVDSPKGP